MRNATEAEYLEAYQRGGHEKSQTCGKRYNDVTWKDRGTFVASKHESITRGKVVQTLYMVNPDYLGARS